MKIKNKMTSILMIVLTLGFYHCGSDGTNNTLGFGATGSLDGFRVLSSTPANGEYYVSTDTHQIVIRMSAAVNQTTIPGNITVIETINAVENNITPAPTNIVANGDVITISGITIHSNSDIEVRMFPSLADSAGNTLLQGQTFQYFYIDFSGTSAGTQGQDVPGPPSVVSFGNNNCTVLVTFSESLQYNPEIEFHSWNLGQVIVPAIVQPASAYNATQYYAIMPQGYSPLAFNLKVTHYVDMSGVAGDPKLSGNMQCIF
jgi:hypothetical protein